MKINITGKIYISTFEQILNKNYKESLKATDIIFDLKKIEWIGFFPCSLFYSWVMKLNFQENILSIQILLPARRYLPAQVSKLLLRHDILSKLYNGKKVYIPYHSDEFPDHGIPLKTPELFSDAVSDFKHQADDYIQKLNLTGPPSKSIRDAFDIIIYELLENVFIHAKGNCPHYSVAYAKSSGRQAQSFGGFMTVFDKDVPYIEIILGDLGTGINNKLRKSYTKDQKNLFELGKNNRKEERILTYAFDFFSTSDESIRKARIDKLIIDKTLNIKTSEVASGLFCVLQAARSNQGQLVVRTPHSILGFDCYSNPKQIRITGRNELGLKTLAPIAGTHYLLRIPLIKKRSRDINQIDLPKQKEFDFNKTGMPKVLAPFDGITVREKTSSIIHYALKAVNTHLDIYREYEGITLIMPPPIPLISRAILIFLIGLNAMLKGKRVLIWCNPRVFSLFPFIKNEFSSQIAPNFLPGTVCICDIMTNKFLSVNISVLENIQDLDNTLFSAAANSIEVIKKSYENALNNSFEKILQNETVLHQPGPFFIVGKYYTEKYYEIPKALKKNIERRRIAEWCFIQCQEVPDILILSTNSLKLLAEELLGIFQENGKKPEVLIYSEYRIADKVLSHRNKEKKALILADVICRGKTVQDLLLWAYLLDIKKILSIIDARPNDQIGQDFLNLFTGKQKRLIPVNAILKDSIEIFKQPIKSETITVIDHKTSSPALYVRSSKTQISLIEMLKGPAKEADALYSAHCEYKEKHYAHFLHLPKLIKALSKKIEVWIKTNVDFISKRSQGNDTEVSGVIEEWHVILCNPEIRWIEGFLKSLLQDVRIDVPTKEELLAPGVPLNMNQRDEIRKSKSHMKNSLSSSPKKIRNCLIIHSAIASGETARLSLEFASREAPDNIMMLCFMARMDPYHRTFFEGIELYRNALFDFGIFLDFPIGAYQVINGNCPMCLVNERLDALQKLASDFLPENNSEINIAILGKISANKPIVLEYGNGKDNIKKTLSNHSLKRAYYRALYEGAFYDMSMQDKLYDELHSNNNNIDRFLEVISVERLSPIFKENELERRLLNSENHNAFPLIKTRLYEILDEENPPFQMGRVIGAFLHLLPEAFIAKSINMMKRFINSYTDISEICIGLLLINALPLESDDFLSLCRQNKHPKTEKLFSETTEILKKRNEKHIDDADKTIFSITLLHHKLLRSGNFSSCSESLNLIALDPDESIQFDTLKEFIQRLCDGWKREISPLISKMNRYTTWSDLKQQHTDFANKLIELDSYVTKLSKLYESIIGNDTNTIQDIFIRSIKIDELRKEIGIFIDDNLSFNFDNSFIQKIPDSLLANNGFEITVSKEIDFSLPSVFCNGKELYEIVNEIIKNWVQHKKNEINSVCGVKVFMENEYVCLEFTDNIPGNFQLDGMGGIRMTKDFCNSYGCSLEHMEFDEYGDKKLRILFQIPRFS